MEASMIIDVSHTCSDGWHEFTSPQIPGLFLTAPRDDLPTVFEEIPVIIAELIKGDTGFAYSVKAEQSYDDYVARLPEEYRPTTIRHYSVEKLAA
jgi:hypothetical protein